MASTLLSEQGVDGMSWGLLTVTPSFGSFNSPQGSARRVVERL